MKDSIIVGVGGVFGVILRYKIGASILHNFPDSKFPWGTLVVNLIGCVIVGLVAGIVERITSYNAETRLFLITGFCGGFTTFSAFGLETLNLMRAGNLAIAGLNILANCILGITGVWVGLKSGGA